MNNYFIEAMQQKATVMKLEEHFIRKAKKLYCMGFTSDNLSSSQMAAVSERIKTASTFHDAKRTTADFLNKQMQKLQDKNDESSWLTAIRESSKTTSLGQTLIEWLRDEKYLEAANLESAVDHLALLKRFWSYVHGQYSYHKIYKEKMTLKEVQVL